MNEYMLILKKFTITLLSKSIGFFSANEPRFIQDYFQGIKLVSFQWNTLSIFYLRQIFLVINFLKFPQTGPKCRKQSQTMQINFYLTIQVFLTFVSYEFRVIGQHAFPSRKEQSCNKNKEGLSRTLIEISQPRLPLNLYSYSVGGIQTRLYQISEEKKKLFKCIQTLIWKSTPHTISFAQFFSPQCLIQIQHALVLNFVP